MVDIEASETGDDDDDIEHDPADLPHVDDTEDVALQKLVRRMSRITGVTAEELMPGLRCLVVAGQLWLEGHEHCPKPQPPARGE